MLHMQATALSVARSSRHKRRRDQDGTWGNQAASGVNSHAAPHLRLKLLTHDHTINLGHTAAALQLKASQCWGVVDVQGPALTSD